MKTDLYTAQARALGSRGLAHRTAAGFVVLTSADGDDMIALIDSKQNDSDLIDQIVEKAGTSGPESFAMLFTAGGDMYLIAAGKSSIVIRSESSQVSLSPLAGKVLVHAVNVGINETAATIQLLQPPDEGVASSPVELTAGTVEADLVEVAVGGAELSGHEAAALEPQPEIAIAEVDVEEAPPGASVPAESDLDGTPPQPEPAPEPEPEAAIAEAPAEASVPAESDLDGTPPEPAAPVEVPPAAAGAGAVMVLGVACSQGHHNHPDAVYCSQCGTKMGVHHTTVLLNGPRPPLGVLVVDDGTTYSLSENLVVGREPTTHDEVVAGAASPMILTDDTLSLSRKHARIFLDDWTVLVEDLSSSNGTYLSRSGQVEAWTKVEPSAPMSLEPGDRLRVGGRIIQVELHHVR